MDKKLKEAKEYMDHQYYNEEIYRNINRGVKGKLYANKKENKWLMFRYAAISFIAAGVAILLVLSNLSVLSPKNHETDNPVVHAPKEKEYNFEQLVSENGTYQILYDKLFQVTQLELHSKEFIYYLEALKRQDEDKLQDYIKGTDTQQEQQINYLIGVYKHIDYSNLEIIDTMNSRAEPSVKVELKYRENHPEDLVRALHINLISETEITVDEEDYYSSPKKVTLYEYGLYPSIDKAVEEATKTFRLGISRDEILEIWRYDFVEYPDPGSGDSGAEYFMTYDFFTSENYQRPEPGHDIMEGFKNGDIHLQITFGMDPDSKAIGMFIVYNDHGKIMNYRITKYGEFIDQLY